jgi:PhnB protein
MKYPALSTYLIVNNCAGAIEFYKKAFHAVEVYRLIDPNSGKIGHAEITIEGMLLMLADENLDWGARSPTTLGGSPCKLSLIVTNVDAAFKHAVEVGGIIVMEPTDMFYGMRCSVVRDPFGYEWMIQQQLIDLTPEEMQTRWNDLAPGSM